MTKRDSIPEETKIKLLRETNYRCGYCMKNITPAAYCTDERGSKEANEIPTYYQPYDAAHIEPYDKTDPETNSFYNLIALCKECHWKSEPKHSNTIIPKNKLKELKLYWMIASGRFTRLEIDTLNQIYFGSTSSTKYPWIRGVLKISDINGNDLPLPHSWTLITFSLNLALYKNLFDLKFITSSDSRSIIADGDISFNPVYLCLTEDGIAFCERFSDVYQDL